MSKTANIEQIIKQMKSHQKLNIIFLVVIIGLIITILFLPPSEKKVNNEQLNLNKSEHFQVLEINQVNDASIIGLITATIIEDVKMKVDGKIDKNNRSLTVGSRFSKNDILIKVERLDALYDLLSARSEFKSLIQKFILSINNKVPNESEKWKQFDNQIQRTLPLPELPVLKSKNEEELLSNLNVFSEYYKTKKTERKAEDYIYLAPFDGVIIESNINPGLSINAGKTVLKLAKNNFHQVIAHAQIKDLNRIKTKDTVSFLSFNGDTLSKGIFSKVGSVLSDSSTIVVYYSVFSKDQNLFNQPIEIRYKPKEVKIPSRAIQNDSVLLYAADKAFKLPIKVISQTGDSSVVEGLPEHCFIILNP